MEGLSYAQSWRRNLVIKNNVDNKGGTYKYISMEAGSHVQWASSLRTKHSLFAQGNAFSVGGGGYFRHFQLGKRHKVGVAMARAANKDYYSILNVPQNANKQEIKAAYKKLARQYHPDMNKSPGAEEKFKEVGAAYEVLSDDERRSFYDQHGEAGAAAYEDSTDESEVSPFDLFDSIFSRSRGAFDGFGDMGGTSFKARFREPEWGDDIKLHLSLSFKEAVVGVEKDIKVSCLDKCGSCKGTGAMSGSTKKCQDCRGKGHVRKTRKTSFGIISQVSTCSRCEGEGEVIADPCRRCDGEGRVRSKKTINIKIPPGVSRGNTIRVKGGGQCGRRGGPTGDLYVFLDVQDMQGIERDGFNLRSKITVNYTEAILGTVVKVETVEGFKALEIPAGTQPGDVVVMRNMGVPKLENPLRRGDHLFVVNVAIPKRLSVLEHRLVKELAYLYGSKSFVSSFSEGGNKSTTKKEKEETSTEGKIPTEQASQTQSFWDSIKNMARSKGSGNKFSSMSLQAISQEYSFLGSFKSHLTCHLSSSPLYFLLLYIFFAYAFRDIQAKFKCCNSSLTTDNQENNRLA